MHVTASNGPTVMPKDTVTPSASTSSVSTVLPISVAVDVMNVHFKLQDDYSKIAKLENK